MTSSFTQSTAFVDNATTQNDITTEESSTNDTLLAIFSNDSWGPYDYTYVKKNNIDPTYIPKLICLFVVIVFVITISIVVIFRRFQYLQKQKTKGKEYLQNDKLYAHPFEEIAIEVEKPESIELLEVTPTTPTN